MGVVVLFFFPTLYCNVSDSWLLPNKWKRMAVSAAGIYVEMLLAATATFVWWWSDSGTFLHQWAFAVMLYCSVNTVVCNANPLMRFDGYHVLADWLEAPNLAQQCQRTLQSAMLGWLGVETREVASDRAREQPFSFLVRARQPGLPLVRDGAGPLFRVRVHEAAPCPRRRLESRRHQPHTLDRRAALATVALASSTREVPRHETGSFVAVVGRVRRAGGVFLPGPIADEGSRRGPRATGSGAGSPRHRA